MEFFFKLTFIYSSLSSYVVFSQRFGLSKTQLSPTIDIPDGLLFGAGTSAFQVEGALQSNGRTKGFMELLLPQDQPDQKSSSASPDISSDSYHRYTEDIKMLKYIGLDLYRFSMSWTRLLPTGHANDVNQEGVDYYHALLDELEQAGVKPMVQLHHFDHPAAFEKFGGWQNETMVELFKDYARLVFKEFGHRVKYFLTFNEPNVMCNFMESGVLNNQENTTQSKFPRIYICSHNILKAHAEAYHLYHNEFNLDREGALSINLLCNDHIIEKDEDQHLIDAAFAFGCGWFADPIFSETGDYSDLLKQRVEETKALQGYEEHALPLFSESWVKRIRGTADFFGLSYYTSRVVDEATDLKSSINFFIPPEARIKLNPGSSWLSTKNTNYIVPAGLKRVLRKIKNQYNNPTIHIIENGFPDDGQLNDTDRIKFIYAHVKQIIEAITKHKCDVKSYIYWSLIDNFEFWGGYSIRFGLAHVDFESPNRTRTPKKSATWLRDVIRTRKLYIEE